MTIEGSGSSLHMDADRRFLSRLLCLPLCFFSLQPVFAPMLQSNPRMLTSGSHPQAIVSSSTPQYPSAEQPTPQALYGEFWCPLFYWTVGLYPCDVLSTGSSSFLLQPLFTSPIHTMPRSSMAISHSRLPHLLGASHSPSMRPPVLFRCLERLGGLSG